MVFAPDTDIALRAAVELLNTQGVPDKLSTVADLDAFFDRYDYTGSHRQSSRELKEVRAVRPLLRQLMTAEREGMVDLINAILRDAVAIPQLVKHDSLDWHVHATSNDAPLATRILVEAAMAMIDVLRANELDRIGSCEATGCTKLVVDLSRNRSRRFCGVACGNRVAAAAYRGRQRVPR